MKKNICLLFCVRLHYLFYRILIGLCCIETSKMKPATNEFYIYSLITTQHESAVLIMYLQCLSFDVKRFNHSIKSLACD